MRTNSIDDQERALTVVYHFLCHAHSWRGPTARRVKRELNTLVFMWSYGAIWLPGSVEEFRTAKAREEIVERSLTDIAEDGKR